MSRNFSVTEPHPSVPKSGGYIGGGIGGAGNYRRYIADELPSGPSATGPPSRILLTNPAKSMMSEGRGGAGNMFKPTQPEEPMFQFDEEMVNRHQAQAPVYHIGRGGAANFINDNQPKTNRTRSNDSGASTNSASSSGSVRQSMEGALHKLQRKLAKA